jgi:hypothetical protein
MLLETAGLPGAELTKTDIWKFMLVAGMVPSSSTCLIRDPIQEIGRGKKGGSS